MTDTSGTPDTKIFVQPLPANPDLEMQRKLAKSLARDFWRGKTEALRAWRRCTRSRLRPTHFL